jgi:penicillin-binding protein 2
MINTLIGLETGAINTNTRFACYGKGTTPLRCTHDHVSPGNVVDAIRESWNTFRSIIYKSKTVAEGFNVWRSYVESFGIGLIISTDFPNALKGDLPTEEMYNKIYGKGRWSPLTIRSLAIGQGELGATPLQMANVAAIVANRGYYYPPHLIREIENDSIPAEFTRKVYTKISPENFEPIITGMEQVLKGNLSFTSAVPGVVMCGKTGTVQNNQGSDHSVFTAFAPKDNPKIAIFVYVENGVWGSRYAAPMAGLMVEKYLNDTISVKKKLIEQRMMEANLLNPNQPK